MRVKVNDEAIPSSFLKIKEVVLLGQKSGKRVSVGMIGK